ncbi:helix-turn-helix domain-containing protein [Streptomyces sp. NPDC004044]
MTWRGHARLRATEAGVGEAAPSGVLSKALAVLQAFSVEDTTLGFAELQRRTGLPKGTLHRTLGDLTATRLLDRVQAATVCPAWSSNWGCAPRSSAVRARATPTALQRRRARLQPRQRPQP